MAGHAPFAAQVILNGHEYVAIAAQGEGIGFTKERTCFSYAYSVFQAEYSRNLLFASGGHMDRVFNAMLDRLRSHLDIPALRTLFGGRRRPGKYGTASSPRVGVALETPAWDLAVSKIHFGLLTLKGYTQKARVLRFEAITHNTRQLGCGWPWTG